MAQLLFALFFFLTAPAFSAEGPSFEAVIGPDGVQRAVVDSGSYFFRPSHIIVKAGVPVELSIKSEPSVVAHNFVMRSPEAGMDISEALSDTIEIIRFTPTLPGRYGFYCDKKLLFFKSHRERGMEGVIEVR